MKPEIRLLEELLGVLGNPSYRPSFSPERIFDLSFFIDLVEKHRLSALFYWKMKRNARWDSIPLPVREAWEERYHAALAQTTLRYDLLRKLLSALKNEGIDVILLKGAHLAESYYPHPALRPLDDVDLLVPKGKRDIARAVLGKAGLKFISETVTARKYSYLDGEGPPRLFLEVHSDLQTPRRRNPSFDIKIEDFWEDSHPVKLYGASVRVLDPALNLIYLSAHLAHHGFSRLIWFYDLHLIMKKDGKTISWNKLAERSKRYRSAGQVYFSFFLAHKILFSPIPEEVLKNLSPPFYKKCLIRFALNKINTLARSVPSAGILGLWLKFTLNDSWLSVLRWLFYSPDRSLL